MFGSIVCPVNGGTDPVVVYCFLSICISVCYYGVGEIL